MINSRFPEIIEIGELRAVNGKSISGFLPLGLNNGICFLTNENNHEYIHNAMQRIALDIIDTLPNGIVKFTFFDGTGLGQNFAAMTGLSSKIKGERILTKQDEFQRGLDELSNLLINNIQNILGFRYKGKTLSDYNEDAPEEEAKPYNVLFIADYPNKFSKKNEEQLFEILKSGSKAGFYVILSLDTRYQPKDNYDIEPFHLLNKLPLLFQGIDGKWQVRNTKATDYYNSKFSFKLTANLPNNIADLEKIIDDINKESSKVKKFVVNMNEHFQEHNLWVNKIKQVINIPVGKINIKDIQEFIISGETGFHAMVGGATGSGKTVFLHNIILGGAWKYSPEEIQFCLLDYKLGVEFNVYKTLPHLKVLSIESDLDFGKSFLEYIQKEMEKRSKLFLKQDAEEISVYIEKSGHKMPRIIIIIDEFQVLLGGAYNHSEDVAKILDDISKRGRSFGIHLILSSQSLAGVNIKSGTLNQIPIRIAMRLSKDDSRRFLDEMNTEPCFFTKPGETIINTRAGLSEANVKFQTGFIPNNEIKSIIEKLNHKASESNIALPQKYIFDGSLAATIDSNPIIKAELFEKSDYNSKIYLGEPTRIDEETPYTFITIKRESGSNVLIIGRDLNFAFALLYNIIYQLIKSGSSESEILILDGFIPDSGKKEALKDLFKYNNDIKYYDTKENSVQAFFDYAIEQLEIRKSSDSSFSRLTLVIPSIYNISSLRKISAYDFAENTKSLFKILREGPAYGIHTIIYNQDYRGYTDIMDSDTLRDFSNKIALRGGEGEKILNLYTDIPLKEGVGLIASPYTEMMPDRIDKFKIYSTKE